MFNFLKPRQGVPTPTGPAGAPRRYRSPKFTTINGVDRDNLTKPRRAHNGDAGYDLALAGPESVLLAPGDRATVPTGWAVRLDPATCGLILPRSGNASKLGLNVITGVVDAGYSGELKVTVHNTSRDKVVLTPGMRVAQLVVTPVVNHDAPAKKDARGGRGFGSTDTPSGEVDMVNHPPHYTIHPVLTGECFDYAKHMVFSQGNAFKYLWRCAAKDTLRENIHKALWYLKAIRDDDTAYRQGSSALPQKMIKRLQSEVTEAFENVNSDTAPVEYMTALACYAAAALVAEGEIDDAIKVLEHGLKRLDSVE